jgi:hypothetical protein
MKVLWMGYIVSVYLRLNRGIQLTSFISTEALVASTVLYTSHNNKYVHRNRIGAATTAWAKGFSEEQIQQMGRWNSKAFKKFIRIPLLSLQ